MSTDPWELLREARESLQGVAEYDTDPDKSWTFTKEACRDALVHIDAALAAHEKIEWHQVSETVREACVVQPDTVRLTVERVTFNDGTEGWWAKHKHSLINAYSSEEEAKAACLKTAKDVADCFAKIALRNSRSK
jgi:hypothetical protein